MREHAALASEPVRTDAAGTSLPSATRSSLPGQRPDGAVGAHREKLASETLRLYAADWARFSAYCAGAGARALPAAAATVVAFLQVPGPGRAARSRRLAAIDHRHRQHDFPCPATMRRFAAR